MFKFLIELLFLELILVFLILAGYFTAIFFCYILDIIFKYKKLSLAIACLIIFNYYFYKFIYYLNAFILVVLLHIIIFKIYTHLKNKKSLNNSHDYEIIKLCKKNIYKMHNSYNIYINMKEYNFNSKELYLKYILDDLLPLFKKINQEQINFLMTFNSILISICSICIALLPIITSNKSDTHINITSLILIVLFLVIVKIRYLLSKVDTKSYLKIYHFEKYLKEELKNAIENNII